MTSSNRVAIIGAGIAGLSCASALQNAGAQVTLFEKSRGVSGRISTRVTYGWQCDHGAQYFTARDSLFHAEVQRWIDHDVAKVWQPLLKVFDGNTFIAKESESNTTRYVGYPQNNAPAKFLAKTLNVVTETTVIGIHKQAGKWLINAMEHGVYPDSFDDVILAIPAPQAATLLKNTASDLFHMCNAVIMRPCFALMYSMTTLFHVSLTACLFMLGRSVGWPETAQNQVEKWRLITHWTSGFYTPLPNGVHCM